MTLSSTQTVPTVNDINPATEALTNVAVQKALAALPTKYQAIGAQYLPALAALGVDGLITWLDSLRTTGDVSAAFTTVLKAKGDTAFLDAGRDVAASMDTALHNDAVRKAALDAQSKFLVQYVLIPLATALLVAL